MKLEFGVPAKTLQSGFHGKRRKVRSAYRQAETAELLPARAIWAVKEHCALMPFVVDKGSGFWCFVKTTVRAVIHNE